MGNSVLSERESHLCGGIPLADAEEVFVTVSKKLGVRRGVSRTEKPETRLFLGLVHAAVAGVRTT